MHVRNPWLVLHKSDKTDQGFALMIEHKDVANTVSVKTLCFEEKQTLHWVYFWRHLLTWNCMSKLITDFFCSSLLITDNNCQILSDRAITQPNTALTVLSSYRLWHQTLHSVLKSHLLNGDLKTTCQTILKNLH